MRTVALLNGARTPPRLVWEHNFEGSATLSDMEENGTFTKNFHDNIQQQQGGIVSVETAVPLSGTRSLKCTWPAFGTIASKADISRGFPKPVRHGQRFTTSFKLKFPTGQNLTNLFIFDIEIDGTKTGDPDLLGNFFGLRVLMHSTGFRLNREWVGGNLTDSLARSYAIPMNTVNDVLMEIFLHQTLGSVRISVGGTERFLQTNIDTMPTKASLNAVGYALVNEPEMWQAQWGLTVNGTGSTSGTLWVDDIKMLAG